MKQFFKTFFASLLALIIFSLIGIVLLVSIAAGFSKEEIDKAKYDFILINLNTIFWEELTCNIGDMRGHLDALNKNSGYKLVVYENNVVLLERVDQLVVSSNYNWTENFDALIKINHDCAKPTWARTLRLM